MLTILNSGDPKAGRGSNRLPEGLSFHDNAHDPIMILRVVRFLASGIGIAGLFVLATTGFGQSVVNFSSTFQTNTHITTNSVENGPPTGRISGPRDSYYFALFVSPPNSVSELPPSLIGWTFTGVIGTNTGTEGRFSGNNTLLGAEITGYDPGNLADFLVFGWSGNIGNTWQQAQGWWNGGDPSRGTGTVNQGWFGYSGIARGVFLGPEPYTGSVFGPNAGQILGFNLDYYVVPEPAGGWVMGLGAIVLLVYRRR